jgi:hypothetical protein
MAAAVAEAHRVLREGGLLLDIHPTAEAPLLEVWHARDGGGRVDEDDPRAVQRVPAGTLETDPESRRDFTAATGALAGARESLFDLAAARRFAYRYFFDTLDELTDYFDDEAFAHAGDAVLERAALAMNQAPAAPRLVVLQDTVVTVLRKS